MKMKLILLINYLNKKLKVDNYTIINEMFYKCKSLSYFDDISFLKTEKVINMNNLFYNCFSLSSLSDIS